MAGTPWKRLVPLAVGISFASIVAIVVFFQVRRDADVVAELRDFALYAAGVALVLHMFMHLLWATRLHVLAGGLDTPLRPVAAWRLVTAGQFAGAVTPARAGAEGLRLTLLVRGGAGGVRASRLVLADRATDMVFFLIAGIGSSIFLAQVFGPEAVALRVFAWTAVGLLSLVMLLFVLGLARPERMAAPVDAIANGVRRLLRRTPLDGRVAIAKFLRDVRQGVVTLLTERPWRAALAMGLSVLIWAAEFGALWAVLRGFGHELGFGVVFAAGIMLTILAPLPISPGGAGVVELAAIILLGGLTVGLGPAFVIVWRALTYYYDIILGGLVAAWSLKHPVLAKPPLRQRS